VPAPAASVPAAAAAAPGVAAPGSGASAATVVPPGITPPPGYTIGPDDVLTIVFWREKDMGADVTVRPEG
jgi:polysaccharide export outer membrane protein